MPRQPQFRAAARFVSKAPEPAGTGSPPAATHGPALAGREASSPQSDGRLQRAATGSRRPFPKHWRCARKCAAEQAAYKGVPSNKSARTAIPASNGSIARVKRADLGRKGSNPSAPRGRAGWAPRRSNAPRETKHARPQQEGPAGYHRSRAHEQAAPDRPSNPAGEASLYRPRPLRKGPRAANARRPALRASGPERDRRRAEKDPDKGWHSQCRV